MEVAQTLWAGIVTYPSSRLPFIFITTQVHVVLDAQETVGVRARVGVRCSIEYEIAKQLP